MKVEKKREVAKVMARKGRGETESEGDYNERRKRAKVTFIKYNNPNNPNNPNTQIP